MYFYSNFTRKIVPKCPIDNKSALVHVMACRRIGRRQAITWTNANPVHRRIYARGWCGGGGGGGGGGWWVVVVVGGGGCAGGGGGGGGVYITVNRVWPRLGNILWHTGDLGQHWFWWWLVSWPHQAITRANVTQYFNRHVVFEIYTFEITATFSRGQWVNCCLDRLPSDLGPVTMLWKIVTELGWLWSVHEWSSSVNLRHRACKANSLLFSNFAAIEGGTDAPTNGTGLAGKVFSIWIWNWTHMRNHS